MRFLLGGYTADMDGHATGVGVLHAGAADSPLASGALGTAPDAVTVAGSPSWITRHPHLDVIYAALEGSGTVQAFARTGPETFAAVGDPVVAGEAVCHVAVSPDGRMLLASCWGDGALVRMPLDAAGRPGAGSAAPAAVDPFGPEETAAPADDAVAAARGALRAAVGDEYDDMLGGERGGAGVGGDGGVDGGADDGGAADGETPEPRPSRAHQAIFLPGGFAASTDLGRDIVRIWRRAGEGLRLTGTIAFPRGTGPRHAVWHASGHLYVVTEFSREVFALAPDGAGSWRIVGGSPLAPGLPEEDTAAEITLSRDGAFLVAGLRGSDTLAVLRVGGDGSMLTPVALADAGVRWPRHHVVVRDTILVAGQRSDEIASLGFDERTGAPGRVRHRTVAPSPTCLLADVP